jgi:hypothetical protein
VDFILSSDPHQICLITFADIVDICINGYKISIGVSLLLLIIYIEAALDI